MNRTLYSVDGNSQRLDGGAMFGNAPRALWERWVTPDERHRIPLACRGLLVVEELPDGNRRHLLFETGIGTFFEPKLKDRFGVVEDDHVLLTSLRARGLTHEEIDVVVLSHLHFDHAGGLLTPWEEGKPSELLFPNATFVVGHAAWARAQHPHPRDRASYIPRLQSLLASSGRLLLVSEHEAPQALGEGYRFHISEGHTPGLLLTEVEMPSGPVLFAGDLIPGRPWVHVPITMGYDRYPERLIDEKQELLTDLLGRCGRLFFTHDHGAALCRISQDERQRFCAVDTHASLEGLTA